MQISASSIYAPFVRDLLSRPGLAAYPDKPDRVAAFIDATRQSTDRMQSLARLQVPVRIRRWLQYHYRIQEQGFSAFLLQVLFAYRHNTEVRTTLAAVYRLAKHGWYGDALFLLKGLDIDQRDALQAYLYTQLPEPRPGLRFFESHRWYFHATVPFCLLPAYVRRGLYPAHLLDQVRVQMDGSPLPPYLVLAVVREESRFDGTILSSAGAIGLMQLLPDLKSLYGLPAATDLRTEAVNLAVGIRHLSGFYDRLKHYSLALAAYNGGEKRMRLLRTLHGSPLDYLLVSNAVWFRETRRYVRKVMASFLRYQWVYHQSER